MEELISRFSETKVLVAGDPILDIYLRGTASRICREAPVPVFDVSTEDALCGGAANAAINLSSLGASTWLATVTGNDTHADTIISLLQTGNVNLSCLVRDEKRSTVVKQRITADNNILFRIDHGDTTALRAEMENELIRRISVHWDSADVIVLSDYGCGIITERIIDFFADVLEHLPKPLIIDAKDPSRFARLKPLAVKPNYQEATSMLGCQSVPRTERAAQMILHHQELFRITGASCICITLDKDGVILLRPDGSHHRILCIPFDNRNAIGAGDTFTAAFSLAIAWGTPPEVASELAANAAAVVVQKDATAGCSQAELLGQMNLLPKFISNTDMLAALVRQSRELNRKIVFTNGCFDILHKGHITFLEEARKMGDVLILAVNNDAGIRKLKGDDRPVNTLEDRISVLSALQAVDAIIAYEQETPAHLIRIIRPDVFVKGNTYADQDIPEADLVGKLGGEVRVVKTSCQHSTSGLINRIRHTKKEEA